MREKNFEQESQQLELESFKTAQEKLDIVMQDDFKDFGVRFMNIEEYRKIIKQEEHLGGEVFVPKIFSKDKINLKEFFDIPQRRGKSGRGWADETERILMWSHSNKDLSTYAYLIRLLKEAHNEAQEVKKENESKSIRERVMNRFKQKVEGGWVLSDKNLRVEISEDEMWQLKQLGKLVGESKFSEIIELIDKAVEAEHQQKLDPDNIKDKKLDDYKEYFNLSDTLKKYYHRPVSYRLLAGMKLDIDATLQYARDSELAFDDLCKEAGLSEEWQCECGEEDDDCYRPKGYYKGLDKWWTPITGADKQIDSSYN